MVVEPTAPSMEKPSTTGLTSPGSGLHDEGDSGVEEAWDAMAMSSGLAEDGTEIVGDAPSGAAQSPPTVTEQASSTVASTVGEALECSVRAWQ